jgi:hypothetical protein
MNNWKLPAGTCEIFKQANPPVMESFGWLDVRLGVERIQDDPRFREAVEKYWKGAAEGDMFPIDPEVYGWFLAVSPRHETLTVIDVQPCMEAILNDENFINSCNARWTYFDAHPDAVQNQQTTFEKGFDLSAMPEGEMTA